MSRAATPRSRGERLAHVQRKLATTLVLTTALVLSLLEEGLQPLLAGGLFHSRLGYPRTRA